MARKKTKKSATKKARRRKISKNSLGIKYPLIALIVLIVVFVSIVKIIDAVKLKSPQFSKQLAAKTNVLNITKTPIPSPTITPTDTPTPVPLTGFCLHVPVLMYHHIQPESNAKQLGQTSLTVDNEMFAQQMQYLAENGYTTLFASELINALIGHQGLPAKSVVITMDDGYEDNYIYALPILKQYGLKANIMLASGLMNNSNMLSWDEVKSMKDSGLIYFTNHTWSHWPISRGPQSKINSEVSTAQTQIQQYTGQTVNVFTYPYGMFNNNAIQTLQSMGYTGAFSEIPGTYQCDSFIMTLHRTRIGNASLSAYGL